MQEADHFARLLWAKTDRDHPGRWHPLLNHLVDIAAVAREMWDTTVPVTSHQRWTAQFGGDEDAAGTWLALLAGLHDVGKASPVFQGASDAQRARLNAAGVPLRPMEPHPIRHGPITAATVPPLLRARWLPPTRRSLESWTGCCGIQLVKDRRDFGSAGRVSATWAALSSAARYRR